MRTYDEVKEIYINGWIIELTKEEIENYFILKGFDKFTYIGESNHYQNTIVLETGLGKLLYIYNNKIMDRPREKDEEDDFILKVEN